MMVERNFLKRLISLLYVNSTALIVFWPQNFLHSLHARPMEYHELVAGTPRITREQAEGKQSESWREI